MMPVATRKSGWTGPPVATVLSAAGTPNPAGPGARLLHKHCFVFGRYSSPDSIYGHAEWNDDVLSQAPNPAWVGVGSPIVRRVAHCSVGASRLVARFGRPTVVARVVVPGRARQRTAPSLCNHPSHPGQQPRTS